MTQLVLNGYVPRITHTSTVVLPLSSLVYLRYSHQVSPTSQGPIQNRPKGSLLDSLPALDSAKLCCRFKADFTNQRAAHLGYLQDVLQLRKGSRDWESPLELFGWVLYWLGWLCARR